MPLLLRFRIGFFLLCLLLAILCCALGIWQLHRYHTKKNLLAHYHAQLHSKAHPFLAAISEPTDRLEFTPVTLIGTYQTEHSILLQNRFYHDRLGYELLTPMSIPHQKKMLLVDRGWIPQTPAALQQAIASVTGQQTVSGYIKLTNSYQFILGKNIIDYTTQPLIAQKIDLTEFQTLLHHEMYPFILRLNPTAAHGFVRDWVITTVLPERHMAYAVQWFALMLVLIIAYFCFSLERRDNSHEKI